MTVRMAITIATMGRLMKNFDIWFRTHLHSLTNSLDTFYNHPFARLDTLVDDPFRTDCLGNLHRPDLHGIAIVDDGKLLRALKIDYCTLWNQQSALLRPHRSPHSSVKTGAQTVSRIREDSRQSDCACFDVDLTVCKGKSAFVRIRRPVGQNQFKFELGEISL